MYSDQGLYDGSPAFIWKDHQLRAWSKMYGPQMYLHGGPASPTDLPAKKNKQVSLHQTRKLMHDKGNHQQNEKVSDEIEENIYKLHA